MAKQQINQKETQVATSQGQAKQIEQTLTVDDNTLPSPQDLAAYKDIDPKIVEHLLELTKKEQEHRHYIDNQKMKIIRRTESRTERMNFWGMTFAFLCMVLFIGLTAFALYLDNPWFAGFFGLTSLISIISIFINAGKNTDSVPAKKK
ncbi:MAG: DUF2335 domain-containing protein [Prevotella sp.]|nr:DUF2335 domain-containing protein [Prevotella sp.]